MSVNAIKRGRGINREYLGGLLFDIRKAKQVDNIFSCKFGGGGEEVRKTRNVKQRCKAHALAHYLFVKYVLHVYCDLPKIVMNF